MSNNHIYITCSEVIKKIKQQGASPKSAIYNSRQNKGNLKAVLKICLALISEFELLKDMEYFLKSQLDIKASNPWLLYVMLFECIICGHKLKMGGKVAKIVKDNQIA